MTLISLAPWALRQMPQMINPSFTRGEYWLLETVVHLAIPIFWLVRDDMEMVLNKQGHGMERSLLVETMNKLFLDGLIAAHMYGDWEGLYDLSFEKIESALAEKEVRKAHYYGLTAKGGAYWEAFASPNWEYFIDESAEPMEDSDIWIQELVCMNKECLETYFRSCWRNDPHHDVDESSIQWDVLHPWKATYWKELSVGHRVRLRYTYRQEICGPHAAYSIDREWYDRQWYTWR
jgi:hypothetical protein